MIYKHLKAIEKEEIKEEEKEKQTLKD